MVYLIKLVVYQGAGGRIVPENQNVNIFVRKLPQAASRLVVIPGGDCWTEMSQGIFASRKGKEGEKTQVYLIYCSCCCPL